MFTGGAKTIAEAFAKIGASIQAVFKTFKKGIEKGTEKFALTFEKFLAIFDYVKQQSKNLKQLLDDLWKFIEGLFAKTKDFLATFSKVTQETFERFGIEIREVPKGKPLYSGIPIKLEENLYALIKDGKEIFRGTKKEVEAISEKLKGLSDDGAKKYLDEIAEIIDFKILLKYESKLKNLIFNKNLEVSI